MFLSMALQVSLLCLQFGKLAILETFGGGFRDSYILVKSSVFTFSIFNIGRLILIKFLMFIYNFSIWNDLRISEMIFLKLKNCTNNISVFKIQITVINHVCPAGKYTCKRQSAARAEFNPSNLAPLLKFLIFLIVHFCGLFFNKPIIWAKQSEEKREFSVSEI